jgi:hypothetical protein
MGRLRELRNLDSYRNFLFFSYNIGGLQALFSVILLECHLLMKSGLFFRSLISGYMISA